MAEVPGAPPGMAALERPARMLAFPVMVCAVKWWVDETQKEDSEANASESSKIHYWGTGLLRPGPAAWME